MKLQHMSVIFILLALPIILVVSYYISLQADTVNMQTSYNTKLLESTKEAIEAFEINTVEWNEAHSEAADSKRRDIMASINTFTTSFANNLGIGGASKEDILAYIPAIAYTLYDGYYIYSPAFTSEVIKNENEAAVLLREELVSKKPGDGKDIAGGYTFNEADVGKILYKYDQNSGGRIDGTYKGENFTFDMDSAVKDYKHILKPFSAYSARYIEGNTDVVINYTLDNYIKIYGNVNGVYNIKSGYLIDTSSVAVPINEHMISGIKSETRKNIVAENLKEQIYYEGLPEPQVYPYVYECDQNTKVYFDGDTAFQVSSTGIRTDLSALNNVLYKKLTIRTGETECTEIYQALTTKGDIIQGTWYGKKNSNEIVNYDYGQGTIGLKQDVSAINYYAESYTFSKWVYQELGDLKTSMIKETSNSNTFDVTGKIFEKPYEENSVFNLHKREVIKESIISNLNQAITSYSRNTAGQYQLPVLSETDWDQILSNVSITTFVQGIPIGMKYYNNYAIATSTTNKEYVDPNEIYLNVRDDNSYHLPYCEHLNSTDELVGYRSIDYIVKTRTFRINETETKTVRYFLHDNGSYHQQACYYCLVQRALYTRDYNEEQEKSYETALARERYAARVTTVPNLVMASTEDPSGGGNTDTTYNVVVSICDNNGNLVSSIPGDSNLRISINNNGDVQEFSKSSGLGLTSTNTTSITTNNSGNVLVSVSGAPSNRYEEMSSSIYIIQNGAVQNINNSNFSINSIGGNSINIRVKFKAKEGTYTENQVILEEYNDTETDKNVTVSLQESGYYKITLVAGGGRRS